MASSLLQPASLINDVGASARHAPKPHVVEVALLTGGFDRPYVFGLSMALIAKGVHLDVIGGDAVDGPEMHTSPNLNFLNLRDNRRPAVNFRQRTVRVLSYYGRLIRYAACAKPKVFHILWNNRFQLLDRTLLMLWYKLFRKKIVLTAHNVNDARRDGTDSWINRLTLGIQYQLADHIFVHTERMKTELLEDFGVRETAVTVIPFGLNNSISNTNLTPAEAKQKLGVRHGERAILFFGRVRPYKGLEYLLAAVERIMVGQQRYRLIIAGNASKEDKEYLSDIRKIINRSFNRESIIAKFEFVPDDETELYFKAADVVVLPYTQIYQSGVLFLGYRFGLPAIATHIGSFGDDIVEGRTGFLCKPRDPVDLAKTIETYFESALFSSLEQQRQVILDYAKARHSWDAVGDMTRAVYEKLLRPTLMTSVRQPLT